MAHGGFEWSKVRTTSQDLSLILRVKAVNTVRSCDIEVTGNT